MRVCPFTGELYQGEIVESTCDSCDNSTTYEECAYGTDVLVLCKECSSDCSYTAEDIESLV